MEQRVKEVPEDCRGTKESPLFFIFLREKIKGEPMKKPLKIGLVVVGACGVLSGCIGQDEGTTVTIRRIEMSELEDTGATPSVSPESRDDTEAVPPVLESDESSTADSEPSQKAPPSTPPSIGGEEITPEEKEKVKRIALEDERVHDLISGNNYELIIVGCRSLPSGETHCMLLLNLENGEAYTIVVNMSEGIVEEIREGDCPGRGKGK